VPSSASFHGTASTLKKSIAFAMSRCKPRVDCVGTQAPLRQALEDGLRKVAPHTKKLDTIGVDTWGSTTRCSTHLANSSKSPIAIAIPVRTASWTR